jgi:hypothetical protein
MQILKMYSSPGSTCQAYIIEVHPEKPFTVGEGKQPLTLSDHACLTPDHHIRKLFTFVDGNLVPFEFAKKSWNDLRWKIQTFTLVVGKLPKNCILPEIPTSIRAINNRNADASARTFAMETGQSVHFANNLFRASNLGSSLRQSDTTHGCAENQDMKEQKMPAVTPPAIVKTAKRVSSEYIT